MILSGTDILGLLLCFWKVLFELEGKLDYEFTPPELEPKLSFRNKKGSILSSTYTVTPLTVGDKDGECG